MYGLMIFFYKFVQNDIEIKSNKNNHFNKNLIKKEFHLTTKLNQ